MRAVRLLAPLLAVALPSLAHAHAGLVWPTPRADDSSIKTAPCGAYAPGSGVRTELVAGATIQVEFKETINHPGWFQVSFAEVADTNFVVVADNIPHSDAPPAPTFAAPRLYTYPITVPSTPCESCALRLIQVMTDRNPPTYYYSCADIRIVPPGGTPDAGAPDAAPPPDAGGPDDAGAPLDGGAPADSSPGADVSPPGTDATAPLPDAGLPQPDAGTPSPIDAGFPGQPDATGFGAPDANEPANALDRPSRSRAISGGCRCVRPGGSAPLAAELLLIAIGVLISRARARPHARPLR